MQGLAREILVILAVKVVALFAIWWVWFSSPEAGHMNVPPERMQHRLVEAPAVQAHGVPKPLPAGIADHAAH